jgi:hypothetical protein
MAANAGPDIIEDGIVFYYDTGNTVKSFIGEPLVNCATDLSSGYNVTVTEVTDGSITPPFLGMRVYKFVTANDYNLHRQGGYYNGGGFGGSNPQPLILGTTTPSNFTTVGTGKYRFGMYIRGEVTNQVGDGVTIDIGDRNQVGTTVGTNINWQLLQTNDTLGIANSDYPYDFFDIGASFNMTFYVAGYGIWRSPGTVTNLPFLQAYPIGTQYITYGQSRSVTQGLLDMVRTSTINIANASFDNNAQIEFDGTNDYTDSGYDLSWNNTNSVSIEFMIKPYNLSGGGIMGKEYPNWEWAFYQSGTNLNLVYWNNAGGHSNGMDFQVNVFPTANTWYHITYTWDTTTSIFYVNGTAAGSKVAVDPSINQNRSNNVMIGGHTYVWADSYFNGKLDLVKYYNKALTASEVLTNYNALKTRFGI